MKLEADYERHRKRIINNIHQCLQKQERYWDRKEREAADQAEKDGKGRKGKSEMAKK